MIDVYETRLVYFFSRVKGSQHRGPARLGSQRSPKNFLLQHRRKNDRRRKTNARKPSVVRISHELTRIDTNKRAFRPVRVNSCPFVAKISQSRTYVCPSAIPIPHPRAFPNQSATTPRHAQTSPNHKKQLRTNRKRACPNKKLPIPLKNPAKTLQNPALQPK